MADYIVTGPDGKKYKMTADSPEAVDHAVQQMFGGAVAPAPAPAAGPGTDDGFRPPPLQMAPPGAGEGSLQIDIAKKPPEPSLVDTIMSGVKSAYGTATSYGTQAAAGANKGVANMLGLPGDLAAAVTGTQPTFGSDQVYGFLFPEAPPPQTAGERITRRVGEELGAAAVPGGAAAVAARKAGAVGAREMSGFKRYFVEPMALDPAGTIRKGATGATGAGTAAGVVGESTGKNEAEARGERPTTSQQIYDMASAFGGYGLTALGAGVRKLAGTLGSAIPGVGPTKQSNKIAAEVSTDEILRAAGVEPNAKGVVDAAPLAKEIELGTTRPSLQAVPGLRPSTADVTGNQGLAAKEFSRQNSPNDSGPFQKARENNIEAVDRAMETNAPQGKPGAFRDALTVESKRLAGEADAAVRPLTVDTTRGERGNTIRAEVDTAHSAARKATQDAYEAADVNAVLLQPTFLAEALDRTTAGLSRAERSMAPQADIKAIAEIPAGETTTLREATSLRTKLIDQQSAALADPGRRYEARVLGQYIEAIEDVIGQSVSAEQRALLEQARAARRAQAEAFELRGDPVAQIGARYKGGMPVRSDENVANLARQDATISRLFEEADTPATRQAIRQELLSDAKTDTAAGIEAFQKKYAQQIARFPGLSDELAAAAKARAAQPTLDSAVAKYLQYGDVRAETAMRQILENNKDPAKGIDDLLNFAGNEKSAVEGARKVFWDIMKADTKKSGATTATTKGVQPYNPAALKTFLDDPVKAAVAARLYRDNPEHLDNVRKISDVLQSLGTNTRARPPGSSGTPQGLASVLPTPETLASRSFAFQRGQVGPVWLVTSMGAVLLRKLVARQQSGLIQKMIDKALIEPEFAATLLKENNPANRAALNRGARSWMGNEASTLLQTLQPDDPDEEVKGAVMRAK